MKERAEELTVYGHLKELKKRLVICLITFFAAFIISFAKCGLVLETIVSTAEKYGFRLGYVSPQEVLIQYFRIAGVLGLILTAPVILWQAAAFIMPAVEKKSQGILFVCTGMAYILFLAGIMFCLQGMFPMIYQYLSGFADTYGITGYVSIEKYISLFLSTAWVIGIVFELPLASFGLSRCGILHPQYMKKALKPAVIVILVLSSVITPPDVLSMVLVATPMILVYVISIGVCYISQNRRKNQKEEKS